MPVDESNLNRYTLNSVKDVLKLTNEDHVIEVRADDMGEYGVTLYYYLTILNNGKFISKSEAIDRLSNAYAIGHKKLMTLSKFKRYYNINGKWFPVVHFPGTWGESSIMSLNNYFKEHWLQYYRLTFDKLYIQFQSIFQKFPSGSIKMKYLNYDYLASREFKTIRINGRTNKPTEIIEIHPTKPQVNRIEFSIEYSLEDSPATLKLCQM